MMDTESIFRKYTDEETFAKIVDYDSVSQMWQHSVDTYPNHVALADGETSVTYTELERQVSLMRGELLAKGVKSGDMVGVYAPNSIFFVQSYLAITTLGACAVLLPAHLDAMTVFGCCFKFGMQALCYHTNLEDNLAILKEKKLPIGLINNADTLSQSADDLPGQRGTEHGNLLKSGGSLHSFALLQKERSGPEIA